MSSSSGVWAQAKKVLKADLQEWQFSAWIDPLVPVRDDPEEVRLEAPNNFFKDWLSVHYLETIKSAVRRAVSGEVPVTLVVSRHPTVGAETGSLSPPQPFIESDLLGPSGHPNLNPEYTFSSFVVGKSNKFAHAAGRLVAEKPGRGYNPLFIYGGAGLGKTHLLQAVGHTIYSTNPSSVVLYVHSEQFTNDLINSIRHNKMDNFRRRYRKTDVLLIDDIHFFAGKTQTMEEFFHTFNTMYEAKKQVILTSDCYPKDIGDIDRRLLSRFEMGLVADIQPPELETRLAILNRHADFLRCPLPDNLAQFLASHFTSDIRELKGAVNRLVAFSSLTGSTLSVDMAKEVLREVLTYRQRAANPEDLIRRVAKEMGVKVNDLRSKRRSRDVAVPRQIAMFLLRRKTDLSLPAIGSLFGGRDHTTVLHAVNKVEEKMAADIDFKNRLEALLKEFDRG